MSHVRCSTRKHVKSKGQPRCDCGKIAVALTADRESLVVTLLDPVQLEVLARLGS